MLFFRALLTALVLCSSCGLAQAGPHADLLGKCLVLSLNDDEKRLMVRWTYAIMSHHPAVDDLPRVSAAEKKALDLGMARTTQRLISMSCRKDTRAVLMHEGQAGLQEAFGFLGTVALQQIMGHAAVIDAASEYSNYVDDQRILRSLL